MPVESTPEDEDRDLVERLKSRDGHAMVSLYDKYGSLVYSIIFRAIADRATAEDLTQETFLRIWNRIHTFDKEKGRLQGWLVTVARNRAFDHLRSIRNQTVQCAARLEDLEQAGCFANRDEANDHPVDRIAKEKAVSEALRRLNKDQREVIELTHFEGMTQTEIAEKLHKPLGTVKSLVRSALKNLRAAVREGVA
jgi:RNA polymerase sigma-70 factor (ECF subfamily)